jgi:hypothetical protein
LYALDSTAALKVSWSLISSFKPDNTNGARPDSLNLGYLEMRISISSGMLTLTVSTTLLKILRVSASLNWGARLASTKPLRLARWIAPTVRIS